MTADLKEAFHLAAIAFVRWRTQHDDLRTWGTIITGPNFERHYEPEPTVTFFGREMSIGALCERAEILSGPLPPLIRELFQSVVDYGWRWVAEEDRAPMATYRDAVTLLAEEIEWEHKTQREQPLTGPSRSETFADVQIHRLLSKLKPRHQRWLMRTLRASQ
jgi:hypothetical protein